MKLQCIGNSGSDLPRDLLDPKSNLTAATQFSLEIGMPYVVYAFTLYHGYIWYYICDGDFTYYPIWNPAPLFSIVDRRVSKYWEVDYSPDGRCESDSGIIVAFPEWAHDPRYYDRLTDRVEADVRIFEKYKKLMDEEAEG